MLSIVLVFPFILPNNLTETRFNNESFYNYINYYENDTIIFQKTDLNTKMTTHQDNTINSEFKEIFDNNKVLLQKENDENININQKKTKRINQRTELNEDKCNSICMTKSCINTCNIYLPYLDFG